MIGEGRRLRDEAMHNVALSHEEWLPMAKHALWGVIRSKGPGGEFTTDDVWARALPHPPEGSEIGPVMHAAAQAGYIRQSGDAWRVVK